ASNTVSHKQSTTKQSAAPPVRLQTFEDFEAVEESMMAPGSGTRGRRIIAAVSPPNIIRAQGSDMARVKHRGQGPIDVTPTKRARKSANTASDSLPRLMSSPLNGPYRPLLHNKQREWKLASGSREERKSSSSKPTANQRPHKAEKQPALLSSQETQLDFSDLVLPTEPEVLVEQLCPPSDQEYANKASEEQQDELWRAAVKQEAVEGHEKVKNWVAKTSEYVDGQITKPKNKMSTGSGVGNSSELQQRILEAVGDCEECKAFYSVPGLVLPQRDPRTLCGHKSKSRNGKDGGGASSRTSRRALETPRSEQKRPTTPDHFWDIDYFPPIRTGGPELLRKSKQL
ncbi:hypothetical protein EV175_002569, partial [Coemansia sp. RSA 1933]